MSDAGQRRRVGRLERARSAKERLRVAEWWPGEPEPKAEPGELLITVRRFFPRQDPEAATTDEGAGP